MTSASLEFETPADQPLIVYRRFFKAPPELVFAVWTQPDHLMQWWGPQELTLSECTVDLRVGGTFRYVLRTPDGQEFGCHGEYREVEPSHRIVSTFVLEDAVIGSTLDPDAVAIETVTFASTEGGTLVTSSMLHSSVERRDQQSAGGMMEAGLTDQFERLDEHLETPPSS